MTVLLNAAAQFTHDQISLTSIWDHLSWVTKALAILAVTATAITNIQTVRSAAVSSAKFLFKLTGFADGHAGHIAQRRLFADRVKLQLDEPAGHGWSDARFAELEAEVEAEGRTRVLRLLPGRPSRPASLRREKSLSIALSRSAERLIILEGDPGSGKSVALRHVAHKLARRARKSRNDSSLIPLYINLREFKPSRRPVDSEAVREFIRESLNRMNDRDVADFLDGKSGRDGEFDRGLRRGTWLLLFDSFDEIPDILSATESGGAVEEYADAIFGFVLQGMKTARAVIASREFRGPKKQRVPRFRIIPLSDKRQRVLVRRSVQRPEDADAVHAGLSVADPDMRLMASNPMFLGLISEYVESEHRFPDSVHAAYESYLRERLQKDEARIRQQFGVVPDMVRRIAEEVAFSIAATPGLGLSPSRRQLHSALALSVPISPSQFGKVLDVLESVKLGWAPDEGADGQEKRFSFAHRRFQEYFATSVVLRDPSRVPVHDLLTSGQWRETAVTILQTQPSEVVAPLVDEAVRLVDGLADSPAPPGTTGGFPWPPGCLHLLQLLDAALGRSPDRIPARTRESIGRILRAAWQEGRRYDRKWAVDAARLADDATTLWLVEQAFDSGSVLLAGAGYSVVSRMTDPPDTLYGGVRQALMDMTASGQLAEERVTLRTQIRRLPDPRDLLRVLRLLSAVRTVLVGAAAVITLANAFLFWRAAVFDVAMFTVTIALFPAVFARSGEGQRRAFYEFLAMSAVVSSQIALEIRLADSPGSAGWILGLIILGASIFYSVWPAAVRFSCSRGHMATPTLWILIPGYYIICGSWQRLRSGRGLFDRKTKAAVAILFLASAINAYIQDHWKFTAGTGSPDISLVEIFLAIVLFVFFALLVGYPVIAAVVVVVRAARRRRGDGRLVDTLAANLREADAADFLRALHGVRTVGAVNRILELACGPDAAGVPGLLRALSDLSAVVETRRVYEDARVPGLDPRVEEWLRADPVASRRVVWAVKSATLDQIARVVEQSSGSDDGAPLP